LALLTYRGLGSGIKRAMEAWPEIDFSDDRDGCLFTATVHRKAVKSSEKGTEKGTEKAAGSPKSPVKTEDKILGRIRQDNAVRTERPGESLGISKRAVLKQIDKLKKSGRLRRMGPAKGGHWEVQ
jgi:ATP-dependent DNA helicase RecG